MSTKTISARGVNPILPTPFTDTGALDIPSLQRLIDYQKGIGVNGVAILGFMGENDKMSNAERRTVIETVVKQAAGEIDVWVGVRDLGTMGALEQAQTAESLGANAVFVAPINIQNDDALYHHFKTVSDGLTIPVMIHDFPTSFVVQLSPELIVRLGRDGVCPYIKLEDLPAGPKLTKVRELSNDTIGIFGGLGGIYFMEELERGALGIMTGFSFSEVLVRIFDLYDSGQHEAATRSFDHYASLIRYEFQPKIGLAYRKHVYHQRGVFASPFVRQPVGMTLDATTAREFSRIVARCGLSLDGSQPQTLV
ncbi:MAG: dihydrodipicolinate synthase family protein [Chloroflexota bacterium]